MRAIHTLIAVLSKGNAKTSRHAWGRGLRTEMWRAADPKVSYVVVLGI